MNQLILVVSIQHVLGGNIIMDPDIDHVSVNGRRDLLVYRRHVLVHTRIKNKKKRNQSLLTNVDLNEIIQSEYHVVWRMVCG